MKTCLAVLLSACSLMFAACAHMASAPGGSAAGLASVMAADAAFAEATRKDGPSAAFLAWFDPADGQFIAQGAVSRGAAAISSGFGSGPSRIALDWTPDGGAASSSGDFATTTGRYTVKTKGQTIEAGRYLSVWRKDVHGAWKVLTQTTIADPPKQAAPPQS